MKGKASYLLLSGLIPLIIWGGYIVKERRFSEELILQNLQGQGPRNKIALLGDSWVAEGAIHIGLEKQLGKKYIIHPFGEGGAKTKKIYQNLFTDIANVHSSKPVLQSGGYKIAVIVAGVNDVTSHLGKDFYAHHIRLLIRSLKKSNVIPVIVTLPEFGVEDYFTHRSLYKRWVKDLPLKKMFDNGQTNPRELYIKEMTSVLSSEKGYYKIDFEEFIKDYHQYQNKYKDPAHLTLESSEAFGIFLGKKLEFLNLLDPY